jgi:hypothetical protein
MSTVPDREAATRQSTGQRISRGLWRWGSSRGALLVPLLLLAATLALSYTFPQASANIRSDPITYEEWLSIVQVRYRRWTPLLRTIGLFHVRDTPWFRTLLALLGLVLLISIADRVPKLVEEWRIRHRESFFERAGTHLSTDLPAEEAADRMRHALASLKMNVREVRDGGVIHVLAQQRAWARADVLLSLLGALFMVAALAINSRWGWAQPGVLVLPNRPVQVGPQGGHRLELAQGPVDSRGVWVEVDGGNRLFVDRERGASRAAFRYELTDHGGPLLSVSAWGAGGEPLALSEYTLRPEGQSELQLVFSAASEEQTVRLFILPEAKTVVRLEWRNDRGVGTEPPRFQQWAFEQGGQQLVGTAEIATLDGAATTRIGGVTYQWHVSSYAVLDLAYQPGRWLLGVGAVSAFLGLVMQFVPRQQAWGMVQRTDEGTVIGFYERGDPDSSARAGSYRAVMLALAPEIERPV